MSSVDPGVGPKLRLSHAEYLEQTRRAERRRRMRITLWQIGILAALLTAWETLTRVPWLVQNTAFDPFFISQPSRVAVTRIAFAGRPGLSAAIARASPPAVSGRRDNPSMSGKRSLPYSPVARAK